MIYGRIFIPGLKQHILEKCCNQYILYMMYSINDKKMTDFIISAKIVNYLLTVTMEIYYSVIAYYQTTSIAIPEFQEDFVSLAFWSLR